MQSSMLIFYIFRIFNLQGTICIHTVKIVTERSVCSFIEIVAIYKIVTISWCKKVPRKETNFKYQSDLIKITKSSENQNVYLLSSLSRQIKTYNERVSK